MAILVKTVRIDDKEYPEIAKWINNQKQFSASIKQAMKLVIQNYGTGDLIENILSQATLNGGIQSIVNEEDDMNQTSKSEPEKVNEKKEERKMKMKITGSNSDDQKSTSSKLRKNPDLNMLS